MRGTIVCGLTDSDEGHSALELGVELSERLGLRLVLAHVAEGRAQPAGQADDEIVARLAREHGVGETAERRVAVGDPALLVGQIAAEEAAAVIVVGSRARRWPGRGLHSKLAEQLERETPVPVVIAPPARGRGRRAAAPTPAR